MGRTFVQSIFLGEGEGEGEGWGRSVVMNKYMAPKKRTRSQRASIHIIEASLARAKSEDFAIIPLTADFCARCVIRFPHSMDGSLCDLKLGELGLLRVIFDLMLGGML